MTKKARARRIHQQLEELFPTVDPALDHSDPFTLLVAVMLSAQTTDKKVNEVTPALFKLGPTPQEMARRSPDEVLAIIRPLGLAPGKSRNVVAMSRLLVERHQGQVPANLPDLEALPGVGHKTASVVMAQAFDVPAFPVDTHIHRLAWRWGLSEGKNVEQTERDLMALFPRDSWNKLHLQIIFFGRQYCPARSHKPDQCPICNWAFTEKRRKEEFK
ncbi:endonuclease III [bacterium]|nr:endonuclease III [bacterium]